MISIEQINGEIAALEEERPTHVVMGKLANLYTVRDHIVISDQPQVTTVPSTIPEMLIESDFVKAVEGEDTRKVMQVMAELMDAVAVTNPRLYEATMRKLSE